MNKKLALFDIDGVVYDGNTTFEGVQEMESTGLVSAGTWHKIFLEVAEYKQGKKSYKEATDALLAVFGTALAGKKYNDVIDYYLGFFEEHKPQIFDYFPKLIPQLNKTHDVYFVTGDFQFNAEALTKTVGVSGFLSSQAKVENGIITGEVNLSLGGNKGIVSGLIEKYGKSGSIAVGDTENDIDMLDKVDLPIAFEPDEKLTGMAKEKGWKIADRETVSGIIGSNV